MKCTLFIAMLIILAHAPPGVAQTSGPVEGETYTVVYNPSKNSSLADAASLDLIYVFDLWNRRYGTRLALWYNVLRPDTGRVHFARMVKDGGSWKAEIPIPEGASLLSYIVSGAQEMDGNGEKTFTRYVLNEQGEPVMNARYFNIPFLRLARAPIGELVREAEREISAYPENFRAYHQYFKLLLEQGKGSPRTQERIANRIARMEKDYSQDTDFLNMAAETWFYILQDPEKALEYRNRIPSDKLWPQVLRIFDREKKQKQEIARMTAAENRRAELRGADLPSFNLRDAENEKVAFPRSDGTSTVLLFWASTSERSRELLNALAIIADEAGSAPLHITAVCLDAKPEDGAAWFAEQGLPFELLYNQGNTLQMLGVDSIPIAYFIDAENTVRDIMVGYDSRQRDALRTSVRSILP